MHVWKKEDRADKIKYKKGIWGGWARIEYNV
jgi:hypothetical protein